MARLTSPPRLDPRWRAAIDDHVIALGWSPNGNTLAAASVAGPVTLFDISNGNVRHKLTGHGFGTTALAWHPDGKKLATAGQDGKVRLWDVAAGTELIAVDGGATWVEHLAWSPKGDFLATAAGKNLRLWAADGTPIRIYSDATSTIADIVWSPRGKEFVTGGFGGVTFDDPTPTGR